MRNNGEGCAAPAGLAEPSRASEKRLFGTKNGGPSSPVARTITDKRKRCQILRERLKPTDKTFSLLSSRCMPAIRVLFPLSSKRMPSHSSLISLASCGIVLRERGRFKCACLPGRVRGLCERRARAYVTTAEGWLQNAHSVTQHNHQRLKSFWANQVGLHTIHLFCT